MIKHLQNTSPKQYLLQLRLNVAIELLAENSGTIAEIAVMCGFQDNLNPKSRMT